MYQTDLAEQLRLRRTTGRLPVSPTVWKLGFTSLFTDASAEMVQSILPVYLVLYLHLSPVQFGVLDGIAQGGTVALISLASGIFADRRRRQKEVATLGYAISAICRLALLAAGNAWTIVAGVLAFDRLGKGIRTAPRDAMISLSTEQAKMAFAFSVHRALDAGGAALGPLLAFVLLRLIPDAFDFVLITSFSIAVLGVGIIALLVSRPGVSNEAMSGTTASLRNTLGLWKQERFRTLVVLGALLGLLTISDSFIYLALRQSSNASASSIPLYAFLTAVSYLMLSIPAGHLADRWGRRKIFLCGYFLLPTIYAILLWPDGGIYMQLIVVMLFGAYYAATDGVMAAMVSATVEPGSRTSGLALLNTATGISRLISSVVFGVLWSTNGPRTAVWVFMFGAVAAIAASAFIVVPRTEQE